MFACNVNVCACICIFHDQILCIVKVCVSQLFDVGKLHMNAEVAALRCGAKEAIFASQYVITSQQATRLSFPCYNRANLLCFSLFMGWEKTSL